MQPLTLPDAGRPDPARTERGHYPLWQEIPTRFGDLDPLGHVNNVAVAQLCEESRVRFGRLVHEQVGNSLHRLVLASCTVHYLAETRYPDPVEVGIGVARIGRSSYSIAQALYQRGNCVALAESTLVHAPVTGVLPLPDDVKAVLAGYRLT
ncbi:MAG TPA: acyl-CoA thioesterase [Pseudonocardiaceae bacterium]|nr:acyl-CoA thioesterase [Pseudonocardiaceae bacterium]